MMLRHLILADASPVDDPAVASDAVSSPAPWYSLSFPPFVSASVFFSVSVSWLFVHLCWLFVHESWLCLQCASVFAFVPLLMDIGECWNDRPGFGVNSVSHAETEVI
jgi:hypothetical protein